MYSRVSDGYQRSACLWLHREERRRLVLGLLQLRRVTWRDPMRVNHGWQHHAAVSASGYSCAEAGWAPIRFLELFWKIDQRPESLP